MTPRIHGGPDALGVPRFDFSTNSNACGPCPLALAAVQQADARHYPDASYTRLRQQLAAFHGVEASRVLLAGSASEFIFRITAGVAQQGGRYVSLPPHSYGDYAQAAQAWGLELNATPEAADLVWACEPSSPLGRPADLASGWRHCGPTLVLDQAMSRCACTARPAERGAGARVAPHHPNKALGLTGCARYAVAPADAPPARARCWKRWRPSWPLGAHGVLGHDGLQSWLYACRATLRGWSAAGQCAAPCGLAGQRCSFFVATRAPMGWALAAHLI
jgi:histidinol-phosphate aminotransferase